MSFYTKKSNENHIILQKVGKGTLVGITGNVFHLVLTFVCYGFITRYITKNEFGYLALSLAFINILAILTCLGFDKSLPTFIAKNLKIKKASYVWESISSSFVLCIVLGIISILLIRFSAEYLGLILHKPELSNASKILSFAIPLIALSTLMVTYLQSFQNVWGKMYQDTFTPLIRLIFITIIIIWNLSFTSLLWAYVFSFFLVALFLFFYTRKHLPRLYLRYSSLPIMKQLIKYSFPLFLSNVFVVILLWSDTIILGFFASADEVGTYNAAIRLARLLPMIYTSTGFIFLPIASQLYVHRQNDELKFLYAFTTKWLVAMALPFFIFFFLAPNETMRIFFGAKYGLGNDFFRVLSIGFLSNILVGMSELSLIAFSKNKIVLFCLGITVTSNILLNFILIPMYGKMGAAIASCISFIILNILSAVFVYRFTRIHCFTKEYLKITIFSFVVLLLMMALLETNRIILAPGELLIFAFFVPPLAFVLTKSLSVEDIIFFRLVEEKLTNKTTYCDRLLSRTVKKSNRGM